MVRKTFASHIWIMLLHHTLLSLVCTLLKHLENQVSYHQSYPNPGGESPAHLPAEGRDLFTHRETREGRSQFRRWGQLDSGDQA